MEHMLEIKNLNVSFGDRKKQVQVIKNLSLTLDQGKTLGLVGESGSGKSVTSLTIMRLHDETSTFVDGEILMDNTNLLKLSEKEMQSVRGNKISMIFQEPMTALNPIKTCGKQIMEPILLHNRHISKKEAQERALELLKLCGIPAPEHRMKEYPHQMSGGMRQRIMIAMALACDPELLIADEPTTALDVTIQAQILDLICSLKEKMNTGIILITHDLGVVASCCDEVAVMYAGQVVEQAEVKELFKAPMHPYTQGLLSSVPKLEGNKERMDIIPGMVPNINEMPMGCRFHPRCPYATEKCRNTEPELKTAGENRKIRCWNPLTDRQEV